MAHDDERAPVLVAEGARGYGEHIVLGVDRDADGGRHLGPQHAAFRWLKANDRDVVDDVVADLRRGIDGRHAARERLIAIRVHGEARGLTGANAADVRLVDVRPYFEA